MLASRGGGAGWFAAVDVSTHQNPAVGKGGKAEPILIFNTRIQRRPRSYIQLETFQTPLPTSGPLPNCRIFGELINLEGEEERGRRWVRVLKVSGMFRFAALPNCGILVRSDLGCTFLTSQVIGP